MIEKLLVANRGEIARRVFRTCRELGIGTVAVYSDADAGMPFVAEADVAVRLPGHAPSDTYLRADLLVDAARKAGADAVHPGYGFLSENPDFARAVTAAGLTWVGPTPDSMEKMASKVEAKKLMDDAGVPVLSELTPARIAQSNLPVLVKASAGGGGRGMRVVRDLAVLDEVVESASREAASAFGDPTVFCEQYVERGRHVEVQILGDHDGTTTYVLGARDCSLQRRHQKVVEEAPPYDLPGAVLESMYAASRAAGEKIGYVGAGTVEFLYDPSTERFFFLEMNTRLQVEHPVTECVAGVDLVALQIAIAESADSSALLERFAQGATPDEPVSGHAVEVRLYAEDPLAGWQPQSGTLSRFEVPGVAAELTRPQRHGIRLDSGVVAGDEIGTHYDAMIAKVIAWGADRADAFRRLAGALERAEIHGVRTNRDLLVGLLRDDRVLVGDVTTDRLDGEDLTALATRPGAVGDSALAAALALAVEAQSARGVHSGVPAGWRNVVSQPQRTSFVVDGGGGDDGDDDLVVEWYGGRVGLSSADPEVQVVEAHAERVLLARDGVTSTYHVHRTGERVDVESGSGHVSLTRRPRFEDPADHVAEGSLLAPMPGSVVAVHAAVGDTVSQGQPVLVLEAMKMQHNVTAPHDGVVSDVPAAVGQQVAAGEVLAVVEGSIPEHEDPSPDPSPAPSTDPSPAPSTAPSAQEGGQR